MGRRSFSLLAAAALLTAGAGCSSDSAVTGASTTLAPATTTGAGDATTTVAPSTEAPTTVAPTAPPTTAGTQGWVPFDPASVAAPLAFPCCGANWYGATVSPPLPAAGQPLADGAYRIDFAWPAEPSQPITATVYRFDQCMALSSGSCEDMGGPYPPEEMGIDMTSSYTLTFTLDPSVTVVLGGWVGSSAPTNFAIGNGADLAELLAAVDAAYQSSILDPIAAGTSKEDVVAGLVASPANGFGPPVEEFSGLLSYTYDGAPPLLYQSLPGVDEWPEGDRGSDIIGRISLLVTGGQLQLQLYAGFYS